MPNRIRAVDAFIRATKEIKTKKATSDAKVFENFLVREVVTSLLREWVRRIKS